MVFCSAEVESVLTTHSQNDVLVKYQLNLVPWSYEQRFTHVPGSLVTLFFLSVSDFAAPALYVCEGHDHVDAEFVEEAALKHTMMLLGL